MAVEENNPRSYSMVVAMTLNYDGLNLTDNPGRKRKIVAPTPNLLLLLAAGARELFGRLDVELR